MAKNLALGIDCGGTNMKIALVDSNGKILRSDLQAISYHRAATQVIEDIAQRAKNFCAAAKAHNIKSLGVGIAGDVDQTKGVVRFSPNLGWKNVPFAQIFKKYFKVAVQLDNDANCAAWGAYWLDAKGRSKNLICLTLGTGVGGGMIMDGKLYRGVTGSAGEIGHMSIDIHGRLCKCGNQGCVESRIGAWGLIQSAEEALRRGHAPLLKKIMAKENLSLNPKTLAQAADAGDLFCRKLWDETGEYLGVTLANLVNVFNPDEIVLAGGVAKAGKRILLPALRAMKARAFQAPAKAAKISISKYDEHLGVVGAALLFQE